MANKKSTPAWLTTFLLRVAGGINYRKLVKASKNPRQASEQTLRGILTYGKDTEFGKEHDFEYILAAKSIGTSPARIIATITGSVNCTIPPSKYW